MDDPFVRRVWLGRAIYLGLACLVMFAKLLPLSSAPGGLPGPDLLSAMTFAWLMRRPEQVPVGLIVAVFLLCDMLFLRAPGLWTLIMLGATEFLRSRTLPARERPFAAELGVVALMLVASTVVEQLALSIFLLPKPPPGAALVQVLFTLAAYPFIVAGLMFGLGLRRIAPGEFYNTGRRL